MKFGIGGVYSEICQENLMLLHMGHLKPQLYTLNFYRFLKKVYPLLKVVYISV